MSDLNTLLASVEKAEGLTEFEVQVLEMLNGTREVPWGAAVSVALEHLSGLGFATKDLPYSITESGRALLRALIEKGIENE